MNFKPFVDEDKLEKQLITDRRYIHQHPELSF